MEEVFKSTELKVTHIQDGDGNDSNDQELAIFNDNCGDADYFVIETKRWAFDSIDDLIVLLEDYKKKLDLLK